MPSFVDFLRFLDSTWVRHKDNIIIKSILTIQSSVKSNELISLVSRTTTEQLDHSFSDKDDWTRGSFSG